MPLLGPGQQCPRADHLGALDTLAQSLGGCVVWQPSVVGDFARIGPTDDVHKKQQHKATGGQTD